MVRKGEGRRPRRHSIAPEKHRVLAASLLAVGHLIGVIVTAVRQGYYDADDFRFAALLVAEGPRGRRRLETR